MSEGLQAELLAELRHLRRYRLAGTRHVRHGWLRHVVKGLEDDPAVQARVHKWACVYWLANFPIIGLLYFGFPKVWVSLGLLVNTAYSLYANFATDYGALSAAQASMRVGDAAGVSAAPAVDPALPEPPAVP